MTINEFLIKNIPFSTKEAISIIQQKRVIINKQYAIQKQQVLVTDLIVLDNKIIQQPHIYFYLCFYKPRGIECTMNKNIKQNLRDALPLIQTDFFPIGRLDKDSEGLLLLTNDGQYYNKIAPDGVFIEKEYIVKVHKLLTEEAIIQLSKGIIIMGKKTRECNVFKIDDHTFRITLTQGLNRQIRRMCYKLEYEVISLIRVRINSLLLDNLKPGEYIEIAKERLV